MGVAGSERPGLLPVLDYLCEREQADATDERVFLPSGAPLRLARRRAFAFLAGRSFHSRRNLDC